jgi:hypothetical protein
MESIEKIREAVCRNRGGLEEATDSQILQIWNSLDEDTQKKYLTHEIKPLPSISLDKGEKQDAVSSEPE